MKHNELKQREESRNSSTVSSKLSPARVRLARDIKDLVLPPTVSVQIINSPEDTQNHPPLIHITISPDDGYYFGGSFKFSLTINENYPIDPPKLLCLNKIFHPNISTDGKICLNILREDWTPALDLQTIVIGLLFLFLEPNPLDPLNKEAAQLLSDDKINFYETVRLTMAGSALNNIKYDCVLSI
ncbi:NEDD8-conjugating protein UBC12 PWA37_002514 [Arxiozyma heterogenica]|uniref:NEDD8-conjugating protein UBC12 n=1 Tax=Arxiozyma heterogenica TaxID=278026 RepID=UPI002EEC195F